MRHFSVFIIIALGGWLAQGGVQALAQAGNVIPLERDWRIQNSSALAGDSAQHSIPGGSIISSKGFKTDDWYPAGVPTTVLGALVNDDVYTNVYFGTNFAAIPRAPFTNSWWFRNEFVVSSGEAVENADLIFEGINYRANIWLNGEKIASTNRIFGAYRVFSLDVSGKLKAGTNILAVEVFPPRPGDFTMGFVDWNPWPPDRGMGLFRPVKLHFYNRVALAHVFVDSRIDHQGWHRAALTVWADLKNSSAQDVKVKVGGRIGRVSFGENFLLRPKETRHIELKPDQNPQLILKHAQLWWPWELGQPHLYNLTLTADAMGRPADTAHVRFGIREVSDYFTPEGYRGYMVNGKKILIRGGGWADELLLRENQTNLETQLQYVRAMNLNTIRLEGLWGCSQRLYDLADQYGILVMAGWSCQWEWTGQLGKHCDEFGGFKSEADMDLATNYLRDQVLWLRNHPSIYVWVLGSDKLPRPELERRYDALLAAIDPTRPTLKTCGDAASTVSGPSGVKMNGPYNYETPNYWYEDTNNGGAFGYNTETGPGPLPPPLDSLKRMIPAPDLWPIDSVWDFHCARGDFHHLTRYWDAFTNRYGIPHDISEFAFKSQAANYEAIRPMFEAFAVNLPRTTGIIQWMLNASWPKLYWQLYDYYLVPGGAFFGTKKGAAPVAVIFDYKDHGVYLVNQTHRDIGQCRTLVTAYDLNSKKIFTGTATNHPLEYGSQKIADLSSLTPKTPVYFLDLHTRNQDGQLADNFYWLSTKQDVLAEKNSTWYGTYNKSYADFRALDRLPTANVRYEVSCHRAKDGTDARVTLKNTGDALAFFIEMRFVDVKSGRPITPVYWDDNYVSLPPHSARIYHAHFPACRMPDLELQGWNVAFQPG